MEKNFKEMYFNENAYAELMGKLKEMNVDDVELMQDCFNDLHNYVHTVDITETQIKVCYARYEGEMLRESVTQYDNSRHVAHNAAILAAKLLNRLGENYGVSSPIFAGDTGDRLQVADFCLKATIYIFEHRKL